VILGVVETPVDGSGCGFASDDVRGVEEMEEGGKWEGQELVGHEEAALAPVPALFG